MPDTKRAATGPLIMEHVVQIESTMEDLRKLFETHTGAAVQHRAKELKAIDDLTKDLHYYGDQLVRVYHDLNKNVRKLSDQIDRLLRAEQDKAA